MKPIRLVFVLISFLMTLTFDVSDTAVACSGGMPPGAFALDYFLSGAETILIGRVRSSDAYQINAILEVDYYFRGDGSDTLILLSQESPEVIENTMNGRPYPTRCAYLSQSLPADQPFVAGLNRSADGHYGGYFLSANADGIFTLYEMPKPGEPLGEPLLLDHESMIQYVAERVGESPRPPERWVMPRPTAVYLTDEAKGRYLLPVDQDALLALGDSSEKACNFWVGEHCTRQVVAPNGLDTAYFYPTGSNVESIMSDDMHYSPAFEGETGVFSHESDLIAVWEGRELRVYATHSQPHLGTVFANSSLRLRNFTTSENDPLISGAGAWSPNGRIFAFSTQSGVWTWDALVPEADPIPLLIATEQPVIVRHFSPRGNYLAVMSGGDRYHIDVHSLKTYPDGLFSSDDGILAVYDTTAAGLTPLTMQQVLPQMQPIYGWYNYEPTITRLEWIGRDQFIYSACGDPIFDAELPGFDQYWCKVRMARIGTIGTYVDGIAFDYDPLTRTLATIIDADSITINGAVIDLSGQIDGEIRKIELAPLIELDYQRF